MQGWIFYIDMGNITVSTKKHFSDLDASKFLQLETNISETESLIRVSRSVVLGTYCLSVQGVIHWPLTKFPRRVDRRTKERFPRKNMCVFILLLWVFVCFWNIWWNYYEEYPFLLLDFERISCHALQAVTTETPEV